MRLKRGITLNQNFEIEKSLSDKGGTASVFLANYLNGHNNRKVAIKFARSSTKGAMDEDVLLRHEVEILKNPTWHHPGIVRVFPIPYRDATEYILKATELEGNPCYMAMEYLPGHSMAENFSKIKHYSFEWKLEFLYQLAVVLAFVHSKGFGHRDLKPDNIMFREEVSPNKVPQPVLIDFALTSNGREKSQLIDQSFTLEYAAPERVLSSMSKFPPNIYFNPRAHDMWSYGILMYELFTGELPFKGTSKEIKTQLISDRLDQELVKSHPMLPSIITQVIRLMLFQQPERRPSIDSIILFLEQEFTPPRL